MSGKIFAWLLATVLLGTVAAHAQQAKKTPRIGFLTAASASSQALRVEAFRLGLKEHDYFEGKNITIDYRFAEGKLDRVPNLAAELVHLKVDIIVTGGGTSTRATKEATVTIPIVMGFDNDPVGNGFVASLARPGGNITGLATLSPEISGKQLELLKEIVPRLSHVGVLGFSRAPGNAQALKEVELAAGALGVKLQYIQDPKDIETAFQAASKGRADAVLVLPSPTTISQRRQIVDLAAKSRLPAMYWATEFVEAGGLMTYSVSFTDLFRRAATYVDKILKGTKPTELPVEQPTKFEFVINLKAAKQIGLTIPPNVLVRADKSLNKARSFTGVYPEHSRRVQDKFSIAEFRLREKYMNKTFRIWFGFSRSDNRKSKACPFDKLRAGMQSEMELFDKQRALGNRQETKENT